MRKMKIVFAFILISSLFTFLFYKSYTSVLVRSILTNKPEEQRHLQENEILVSFLPLEQGESTLTQQSGGETCLIDTGTKESSQQLIDILHQHRVVQINSIVLTNPLDEHMGGLNDVLNEFHVDQIYIPELIANSFSIPTSYQSKVRLLKKDDVEEWNQVKMTVLAPDEPLSLSPQDNSLVFVMAHQKINFLFTSDINDEIEKRLIKKYPLKSEILKVSDFGNDTASNPDFLKKVDPQIGIVFSSDPELYHVSPVVVERLKENWTDVYQVVKDGEIQILSNGKDYQFELVKQDD
ncbi:MBL fold metallo-hydrolase [Tepidibacillus marianensis]|uniref:ComEC/Rec2 family competence protein n=1 Tax=Tepidibacillus marianensis TaxID=3131995 RepID=UPI0030D525FC